jgi:HAD superfamily hydrolase (TIGR01509 family)
MTRFDPPLKAVLFDMDGTLCHSGTYFLWRIARDLALSPISGRLGPLGLVRMLTAWRRVREALRVHEVVPGLHRTQIQMTADLMRLPYTTTEAIIRELIYDHQYVGLAQFAERDARASLTSLKNRPLKLGVLSDYPTQGKLAGMGLADVGWDVLLSSEDVDAMKPQPRIFRKALEVVGVEPREALYVGDRTDTDVAGAAALGMRTCLMKGWRRGGPAADLTVGSLAELVTRI